MRCLSLRRIFWWTNSWLLLLVFPEGIRSVYFPRRFLLLSFHFLIVFMMVDDVLFELLHMETVHALVGQPSVSKTVEDVSLFFMTICLDNDWHPNSSLQPQLDVSKLEDVGYNTGYKFVEKMTKDWARFKDEVDIMKFICKEFWSAIFRKQVDNLRTNHQGVYVLLDQRFRFITRISNSKQFTDQMARYLSFTCGLLRGALDNLGLTAVVTAEVLSPPVTKFQIQIQSKVWDSWLLL